MRFIFKVFLFSLVVFLLFFLPGLAGQNHCEFDIKGHKGESRDGIAGSGLDKHPGPWDRHPFYKAGGAPNLSMKRSSMSRETQKVRDAIVDDYLVNDDTTGGCPQDAAAVARNSTGNFVITWLDERNGSLSIYAQRYNSSGTPVGSNFMVDVVWADASTAIAMDESGNFIITWGSGGYYANIYAQRFDSSGAPRGTKFIVNDDAGTAKQYFPDIAIDASGNFVITWEDYRKGNFDVYAQIYDSSASRVGDNFQVNDFTGDTWQGIPAIASDASGNFVITWTDYRLGYYYSYADIYAQIFDSSGTPAGLNFKVNDDPGTVAQTSPDIARDASGNFVITWDDKRGGNFDIYLQRYLFSGTEVGNNSKISDDTGTTAQENPTIATDGSGGFVITWQDKRNGFYNPDIYAQRYNFSGNLLGSNFKVNDDTGTASQVYPDIGMDGSGNFVIAWTDFRNSYFTRNPDIYAQKYNLSGNPLDSNFRGNDDVGSSYQTFADIAVDGSGNFFITWSDYRYSYYPDIYAQRYDFSGNPLDSNFKVNEIGGTTRPEFLAIASDGSGNFVITWVYSRYGFYISFYAQRYDSSGNPRGSNFQVNDDSAYFDGNSPAIAMHTSGNFVITWSSSSDIYAKRYDSSGAAIGSNFLVDDDAGPYPKRCPSIAMDNSANFVITWEDNRNGPYDDIYAQIYDSSGTRLDTNFRVNDDAGTAWQEHSAIAMDGSGNFVITWEDTRSFGRNIYAQMYDSSGDPVGSNFKVNDDVGTANQYYPDLAMDGSGNFIICWQDYRNGDPDIYAQRYNSSGDTLGGNYLVPNANYASFAQEYPAVAANGDSIYFTWQDNRRAKGWDIYAKVVDWTWTKVEEDQEVGLPYSFGLSQNYPNPFNPVTRIRYTVGSRQTPIHATLKVYNILGQLVKTLVDEEKAPGNYNIIWDGKDNSGNEVASGIYFSQLKTKDFTATRKMILLR